MTRRTPIALLIAALLALWHMPAEARTPRAAPLRIVSWNMEWLAERDGAGCRPRTEADYARMRRTVEELDADVVAFQEVESAAAAHRVFDPARYRIVIEARPNARTGDCGRDRVGQALVRQAVGFAIRRNIPFDRAPDVTALQLGDPDLRSGVDVTIRPRGGTPLRLLAVHLKSGCARGAEWEPCPILHRQFAALETWIDHAARGRVRFAVLGDWNRRLATGDDLLWREIDDADPPNADLILAGGRTTARCDRRYSAFIDHITLDRRAGQDLEAFREVVFPDDQRPSDHCPIEATLRR